MTDKDQALRREIELLGEKTRELTASIELLFAFRLIEDGHAADLRAAIRMIREDRDRCLALYRNEGKK